jgi:hypothetical protein
VELPLPNVSIPCVEVGVTIKGLLIVVAPDGVPRAKYPLFKYMLTGAEEEPCVEEKTAVPWLSTKTPL